MKIVVIDDDKNQRENLGGFLQDIGHKVHICDSGDNCIKFIEQEYVDLIITDFRMPGMSGLDILRKTKEINPDISVIIVTAFGTVEDAVKAMKLGAADYITKPIDLDEMEIKINKLKEHRQLIQENLVLKEHLRQSHDFSEIIYKSKAMDEVLNLVARVSSSDTSVFIHGESGTGKEMIAAAIHEASPRKNHPFIAVNCAAIPDTLFESELFGHEKGAFTGANERKKGRFEIASNGTIFLDEVADIPINFQVKLLRVLNSGEFQRLGSSQNLKTNARIISATNKNLKEMAAHGEFRSDLYYRLNVVPITIPPLRDRKEDISLLAHYFIKKHAKKNKRHVKKISSEALDMLARYEFPGNVRELENILERAMILSRDDILRPADFPIDDLRNQSVNLDNTLTEQVEELEMKLIRTALAQTDYIQTKAAEILGLTERGLRYKMQKYKIK
ncbi:MAG: sigma-54-dependent Fis family transcriptional regulator [Candidatus Marinimicrobia bacterium]|nr:sigma-54-dependent Fis family transcriptional regulator [Candidatus Neomarinimicrobiota bacterium]